MLVDHRQQNLSDARNHIRKAVDFLNERGLTDREPNEVVERIGFTLNLNEGVDAADIVLETITEDLAAKG